MVNPCSILICSSSFKYTVPNDGQAKQTKVIIQISHVRYTGVMIVLTKTSDRGVTSLDNDKRGYSFMKKVTMETT